MGELMNEGTNLGNDFDLTQFYAIFFEEAGENLDQMEQMLLAVDVNAADDEELNAIFRCAHSIKGGAATFGFADVAELTHQMESLLDKLRRHELKPTPPWSMCCWSRRMRCAACSAGTRPVAAKGRRTTNWWPASTPWPTAVTRHPRPSRWSLPPARRS